MAQTSNIPSRLLIYNIRKVKESTSTMAPDIINEVRYEFKLVWEAELPDSITAIVSYKQK